jgi:hypothetical protein
MGRPENDDLKAHHEMLPTPFPPTVQYLLAPPPLHPTHTHEPAQSRTSPPPGESAPTEGAVRAAALYTVNPVLLWLVYKHRFICAMMSDSYVYIIQMCSFSARLNLKFYN